MEPQRDITFMSTKKQYLDNTFISLCFNTLKEMYHPLYN